MAASRPIGRSFYNLSNAFRNAYATPNVNCNALLRNLGYRPMVKPIALFQPFQRQQFSTACIVCSNQVAHASTTPNHCTPLHATMQTHCSNTTTTTTHTPVVPPVPAPVRINRRTELDFEELQALQVAGAISLIDVRHPQEIETHGEIPGSVNIPLCKVKVALQLSEDDWANEFCMEKPCKFDRNLVFYARGPNASSAAVEIAHRLGFKKSRHYIGGWEDYCRQTGVPLKKPQDDGGFGSNAKFYQDRFDQYFL